VLTGGGRRTVEGFEDGYYVEPTVFLGDNSMRIFQEEIFGPVLAVTTFKHEAEAIRIANDTLYGLVRRLDEDGNSAYRLGRPSRPVGCGPTATTPTRRMLPSWLQGIRHRA